MQGRVGELDAGEVGLDEQHDRTVAALRLADERVDRTAGGASAAPNGRWRRCAPGSRRLSVGLDRKDGAAWLQKNRGGAGLFGPVAELV